MMNGNMNAIERVPEVVTPELAAEYLQVNREAIYRYIRGGQLVASKLGRAYRIPRRSLDLLLWSPRTQAPFLVTLDRRLAERINQAEIGIQAVSPGDFIITELPDQPDYPRVRT
jgi:excisionase family DNA binding protein